MGRPVRLTDEERKRSNAERQRRWKARHLGFAKLKERNAWAKRKAIREKATPNEKVFTPNAHSNVLPHFGDDLRYEDEPGVDVGYTQMEPKPKGGLRQAEVKVPAHEETLEEKRTYARLEEFKVRRAALEKKIAGVVVELIL